MSSRNILVYLGFIGIIISNSKLESVMISLNSWHKDNKSVFIIGDEHCFLERGDLTLPKIVTDKAHKALLLNQLKNLKTINGNLIMLIESSKDFIEQYKKQIEMTEKLADQFYTGLYLHLPIFADQNNYKCGKITFTLFDMRSTKIRTPVQFYQNFDTANDVAIDNNHDLLKVLNDASSKNKQILEFYKRFIFDTLQKVTINEYLQELNTVIEHLKTTDDYNDLVNLKQKSEQFWSNFNLNQDMGFALFNIIKTEGFNKFQEYLSKFMIPLSSLIADASLSLSIVESLTKCDTVIIFCGQHHAMKSNSLMKKINFIADIATGRQETAIMMPNYTPGSFACKNEEIKKLLENMAEKLESGKLTNCSNCGKSANKKCTACKSAVYCSVDCQKNDWQNHKVLCKKK